MTSVARRSDHSRRTALACLALATAIFVSLSPSAAPARAGEGESPPAVPPKPAPGIAIDKWLKGEVVAYDKSSGTVEVRYDLNDPAQFEDFAPYRPFRVQGTFEKEFRGGGLRLKGIGGFVWKPILKRSFRMEYDLTLHVPRDAGSFVAENRDSEHYTMFSVYDQFFQNKDSPGSAKQHMICRFLPSSKEFGGDLVFRYVIRGVRPPVTTGKPTRVRLGKDGIDDWMEIDGARMAGGESQWPDLRGLRPGIYVLNSDATFASLVLRGDLDPGWATDAGVDLSLPVAPRKKEVEKSVEPTAEDFAARDRIKAFQEGRDTAAAMLRIVEDPKLVDAVRAEAEVALKATGDITLVPKAVPLLESTDLVARTLADDLVSALTGREFGFHPDDPEERRHKAVSALVAYIQKNPKKFQ